MTTTSLGTITECDGCGATAVTIYADTPVSRRRELLSGWVFAHVEPLVFCRPLERRRPPGHLCPECARRTTVAELLGTEPAEEES